MLKAMLNSFFESNAKGILRSNAKAMLEAFVSKAKGNATRIV